MGETYKERMSEEYIWFLKMSILFGVFFTFCIYKNLSGIMIPVLTMGSVFFTVLFVKKAGVSLKKDCAVYFAGIILLGLSTCMTTNSFFHFFNYVGIILLFMAVMFHQLYDDGEWVFLQYVKNFFLLAGKWIVSTAEPFRQKFRENNGETEGKRKISKTTKAVLAGIVAAIIFLSAVMPLLMMSDRIFSEIFSGFFRLFDIGYLMDKLNIWNICGILITFLIGMIGIYSFFAAVFSVDAEDDIKEEKERANPVAGITFSCMLTVIYVIYALVQIVCLFLRMGSLPDDMTYSQYAHEGFWQLLFVSMINFATVNICSVIFKKNKVLNYLLCAISCCTCIMILSAAYRMILYVEEYNLTFLRILVLWFLCVLMIIFFGVIYSIFRSTFRLFRYIMIVLSSAYLILSFSHTDRIIAEYNLAESGTPDYEDILYVTDCLSDDAAPALAGLDRNEIRRAGAQEEVRVYFENIRFRYRDMNLRTWNLSAIQAVMSAERWNGDSGIKNGF